MTLTLSAPGKTYLVGEYAVLARGLALVLSTAPRFELRVSAGETSVKGIPDRAPAHRWLEARRPVVDGWQIEFVDPYRGQGGLGASGAQFLLVHCLTTFLQSAFGQILRGPDAQAIWRDYQVLCRGEGSGGDLLAQAVGSVAELDMQAIAARPRAWPYPELSFSLVRTHQKVPTHEHLRALDRDQLSLLTAPAHTCVEDFGRAPAEVFLAHVAKFSERLRELGLEAPTTRSLIQMVAHEPWCLLAKGCGALGADTVLFFYATTEREKAAAYIRKQRLQVLATNIELTHGLELRCH